MNIAKRLLQGLAAVAAAAVLAGPAIAAEAMLCQTDQSFDCAPGAECIEDSAQAIGLPPILKIDLAKNVVHGKMPDGTDLAAEFAEEVQKDGRTAMSGIQAGLGWSIVVAEATGAMTLAVAGDEVGFIVFGTCVPD